MLARSRIGRVLVVVGGTLVRRVLRSLSFEYASECGPELARPIAPATNFSAARRFILCMVVSPARMTTDNRLTPDKPLNRSH